EGRRAHVSRHTNHLAPLRLLIQLDSPANRISFLKCSPGGKLVENYYGLGALVVEVREGPAPENGDRTNSEVIRSDDFEPAALFGVDGGPVLAFHRNARTPSRVKRRRIAEGDFPDAGDGSNFSRNSFVKADAFHSGVVFRGRQRDLERRDRFRAKPERCRPELPQRFDHQGCAGEDDHRHGNLTGEQKALRAPPARSAAAPGRLQGADEIYSRTVEG